MTIIGTIHWILWTIGIAVWVTEYLKYRVSWGAFGDELSLNIPNGIP